MFSKRKYNILVLGCDGMLGYDVYNELKTRSMYSRSNVGVVVGLSRKDGISLHERYALSQFLAQSIHFDYCINCTAYTNTNDIETSSAGKLLSYQMNALAPGYIAESCNFRNTKLIHISTDYVFSELSQCYSSTLTGKSKFWPNDKPFPISIYGRDKLFGELAIEKAYGKSTKGYTILRTSWLYGMHNSKSFIHKFLKHAIDTLAAGKTNVVDMVKNERSVPTSTQHVVECMLSVINAKKYGIVHAVADTDDTDAVGVSRLQFAQEILANLNALSLAEVTRKVNLANVKLLPIVAVDGYHPLFSVMACTFGPIISWKKDLERFFIKNRKELASFMQYIAN